MSGTIYFTAPWPLKGPIFMLAALLHLAAWARDYPVSSRQEFESALKSARPGDTLVFKDGTWRDVKLNFRAQGEAGRPVTLRAETPGRAVFEGASELVIDGAHLVVSGLKFQNISNVTQAVTPDSVTVRRVVLFTTNATHCRLTESAIVDSGPGVTTYVHLRPGSFDNRVDHCFFANQGGIGVTFYVEAHPSRPNNHLVDHNYFGDRKPGRGNGWETMRIGHSAQQNFVSGTTVAHNYFYRCNGELECISNKSTGNRYLYNSFVENQGQLTLRHGDKAWIEGNYFLGGNEPDSQGVRISGSEHVVINNYFKGVKQAMLVYNGQNNPQPTGYAPVNNTLIAFNTFEDCDNNLILGVGERDRILTPKNLRIANNLVQAKSGKIIQPRTAGLEIKYEGNIMFGVQLGTEHQEGISTEEPVLKKDAWGRIFPDATKLSAGVKPTPLPQADKDINGHARTGNANVGAIGARSLPPLNPLSRQGVGPLWMGRKESNGRSSAAQDN